MFQLLVCIFPTASEAEHVHIVKGVGACHPEMSSQLLPVVLLFLFGHFSSSISGNSSYEIDYPFITCKCLFPNYHWPFNFALFLVVRDVLCFNVILFLH